MNNTELEKIERMKQLAKETREHFIAFVYGNRALIAEGYNTEWCYGAENFKEIMVEPTYTVTKQTTLEL